MKKIYLISIIITLFLSSCEKIITMDIEKTQSKIVVNSLIYADSIFVIQVTKSLFILDKAQISPVLNAKVNIFEDDIFLETLTYNSDLKSYVSINTAKKGKTYKIEVEHESLDKVVGSTKVENPIAIQKIDTLTLVNKDNIKVFRLNISFQDDANKNNYYFLKIINRHTFDMWDPDLLVRDTTYSSDGMTIVVTQGGYIERTEFGYVYFDSNDIVLKDYDGVSEGVAFNDELFNGKNYSLSVDIQNDRIEDCEDAQLLVELHSISEDWYKYLKTLAKHRDSRDNPFSEPVFVYSNLASGMGIVGSSTIALYTITLPYIPPSPPPPPIIGGH